MIYNSLILPYPTYCNIIWSIASRSRLDKIEMLKKMAMRIINKASYLDYSISIFKEIRWLKNCDNCRLQTLIFDYKYSRKLLPGKFAN